MKFPLLWGGGTRTKWRRCGVSRETRKHSGVVVESRGLLWSPPLYTFVRLFFRVQPARSDLLCSKYLHLLGCIYIYTYIYSVKLKRNVSREFSEENVVRAFSPREDPAGKKKRERKKEGRGGSFRMFSKIFLGVFYFTVSPAFFRSFSTHLYFFTFKRNVKL